MKSHSESLIWESTNRCEIQEYSQLGYVNSLRANTNIYLHFISLLHIDITHVIKSFLT